jgi:hypothetical protein
MPAVMGTLYLPDEVYPFRIGTTPPFRYSVPGPPVISAATDPE